MLSGWIDFKLNPPRADCVCWVINNRYGMEGFKAIYHKRYDVFILCSTHIRETIPLDVTHYYYLPAPILKE